MYTEEMLESIKKVEASRASRIGKELRRMDADDGRTRALRFCVMRRR